LYSATSRPALLLRCVSLLMAANSSVIRSPRRRGQKRRRQVEAERLRHDQVNDEVELSRAAPPEDRRASPQQNLVDQIAGAPLKSIKATVPTRVENSYFS